MGAGNSEGNARFFDQSGGDQPAVQLFRLIAQELMHSGKFLATCLKEYISFNASVASLAIPEHTHTPYIWQPVFCKDQTSRMTFF